MPAPVGFIPDNAPEGFMPDEEAAPSVSKENALKLGIGFSAEVPSMLSRVLQSGAEGSQMARDQLAAGREKEKQTVSEAGIGAKPLDAQTILDAPGKVLGTITSTAGDLLSDWLRRSGIDPSAEPGRNILNTGPLPITNIPGTGISPLRAIAPEFTKGVETKAGEVASGFTEPGQAALLPVAPASKVVQGLFAGQALAQLPESVKAISEAKTPQELGSALTGAGTDVAMAYMLGRGLLEKGKTPDATQERAEPRNIPIQRPGDGQVRPSTETGVSGGVQPETPVQAQAPEVTPSPAPPEPSPTVAPSPPTTEAQAPSLEQLHEGTPDAPKGNQRVRIQLADGTVVPGLFNGYWDFPGTKFDNQPSVATLVGNKWSHGFLPEGAKIIDQIPSVEDWKAGQAAPAPTAEPEKITGAAVKAEGQVHTGANHPEILQRLGIQGFETPESRNTSDFGFVTNKGRFITREEAGPIAEASGQNLKTFEPGEPVHSNEVASPKEPGKPLSETKVPEGETETPQPETKGPISEISEAKVKREISSVARSEGQLKANAVKKELLGRIDDELKKGESPNAEVSIDIPGDGSFKVPNTKEALTDFRAKVKALPVKPEATSKIPISKETLKEEADKVVSSYGSPEAAWQSAKRQREALPDNDPETPEKVEKADLLLDELYQRTKAGIADAQAEKARDLAATYRSGGEGFRNAIAKIESLKRKTADHLSKLADLQSRYAENQKRLAEYEKSAAEFENVAAKEKVALEAVSEPEPPPVEVDSSDAEIGVGNETGAEMSRYGTVSGLPPWLPYPERGPRFASELLEASRQLGTLVRSRVTLPKGVQGQYVRARSAIGQNDRIEVGEIRNQLTVAHEMGHDLDALIWPAVNLARSQRSLEARVPGTTGKQLQAELVPVSEMIRGPITGTKGHQAYRKSAVELIADFFALYAHNPEVARRMAPKFSEGFEKQLATKPDAAGVVNQLLEGNVEPVPAEQTASGPAATPTATPGKVLSRLLPDPVKRDFPAAVAAQDLVKGTVREFESRVQRARVTADKWREDVPGRADRSDVGAFVEGIGNIELPGDTIDNVKDRMSPAMRQLAKTYRFAIEAQRNDINAYLKDSEQGEYLKFLEDYLPHFYANSTAGPVRAALSKFIKDSPNAKARKLPTVREAIDLGLIPITQDPAVLYEHHANINWRVATNRQLMSTLKDMKLSTGEPAVVPAKDAPPGWEITQNPLVQKVYARQTPNGVMIWKGGAAIHPDVWHAVRQILEEPVSSDLGKLYDALNGLTRANAFAFSMFHDLTLRSAAAGEMMGANPLRGLVRLFERNPITGQLEAFRSTRGLGKELLKDEEAVTDAAKHGLKFSWTESESYQHNARDFLEKAAAKWRDVPFLGKSAALARDIQHMRQEGLWKNTHDAFKIVAYNDAVSKALADAPKGTDPKLVKEQIASRLNDAFGGQEWQTKFWLSPQIRRTMSRFFLAPDWTLSTLRSVPGVSDAASIVRTQSPRLLRRDPGVANTEGVAGNLGRGRFWAGELAALAGATLATQYAIYSAFGDPNKGDKPWVWDNESGQRTRIDITPIMRQLPWHDAKDPTRYYVNLGKRPAEVLNWFIHPEQNIQSKMSRPVAEVFHQITGMEGDFKEPWKQDHETFAESIPKRSVSIGKEFVPFVFGGNQFALSVPYRKGMTKSKAQNAYESVYELAADPNRLRSLLRGQQPSEGSLQSMVSDITDAATRNGVPAEEIRKRALSAVRGHHYSLYFKALKDNDKAAMEEEANAIIRLGGTQRGMQESIINREKLSPRMAQ